MAECCNFHLMKQCVFIIDDRTQFMPVQSVVDVEAISSSTCIISTAPAAYVLTPSLIRSAADSFFDVPGTAWLGHMDLIVVPKNV
uniref:Uncharacterized protein n=1 Tax=Rhodnius prolixus TaxID=13249 RepID=T1I5V7_RHOPR